MASFPVPTIEQERDRRSRSVCVVCEGPKIRWGEFAHQQGCQLAPFEATALGSEFDNSEDES